MSRKFVVQIDEPELSANSINPTVKRGLAVEVLETGELDKQAMPNDVKDVDESPSSVRQSVTQTTNQNSPTAPQNLTNNPSVVADLAATKGTTNTQLRREIKDNSEPVDYWQQNASRVDKLLREERLGEIVEKPEVKTSKTAEKNNFQNRAATGSSSASARHTRTLDKIERFYQLKKPTNSKPHNQAKKKISKKNRIFAAAALVIAVILISAWLGVRAVKAQQQDLTWQISSLVEDLKSMRLSSAQERNESLRKKIIFYQKSYRFIKPAVILIEGKEKANHIEGLWEVGEEGVGLIDKSLIVMSDLEQGYSQFADQSEGKSYETLVRAANDLNDLYTSSVLFQQRLSEIGNPYQIQEIEDVKKQLDIYLPDARKIALITSKISQVAPKILAADDQKTYLILFQNNSELRPTGGFIGSVAMLTIQDGKLMDFKVEDVYEIDGQLDGFVTPPDEIVQYLDESQWYLRDVNWSPNFPQVAQRAGWFLDKSIGLKPDGVIGINLNVAQMMLAAVGPIEIPDYKEVVTKETLHQQAQTHAEINFFPGSTGKKDFLSAVSSALMNKIMYQPTNKLAIGSALFKSLEQADLMISLSDPEVEAVLSDLSWNGQIKTPACPDAFNQEDCFVDTVFQVEANVGVNKANQFIERKVKHQTEILSDKVLHSRTITWKNNSQSEAWPAGDYKVYTRMLVTQGSRLVSVKVDGADAPLEAARIAGEGGKESFGYYLEIPIKSSKNLTFVYETPLSRRVAAYALFEQKQSGINGQIEHLITTADREVVTVAPEPEIIGRQLRFNNKLENHQFFAVELD